jgi:elongator complex protein 6
MTSRIPHLLEPYLSPLPQEATLVVLTSVLGASTNWLVLRQLHALLKSPSPPSSSGRSAATAAAQPENGEQGNKNEGEVTAVLLLSFLRDLPFWKDNLSRLGIDLDAAARRGRFAFVDGLGGSGGLFSPGQGQGHHHPQPPSQSQPHSQTQAQSPHLHPSQPQTQARQAWNRALTSPAPGDIARVVLEGVEQLMMKACSSSSSATAEEGSKEKKVVLVIDGLDFVLAALDPNLGQGTGDSSGTAAAAAAMKDMLMELREVSLLGVAFSYERELNVILENTRCHRHAGG